MSLTSKLLSLFALAVALHAEDTAPLATAEELTKQVAEQKTENERLTKMLNAYAQKYQRCDQELTVLQTLGANPQPTRPQQVPRRPSVPPANTPASKGKTPVEANTEGEKK